MLAAHQEGWKRLQRHDAVTLVARILSRLTPVTSSPSEASSPHSKGNRESIGDTESTRDSIGGGWEGDDRSSEAIGATTEAALLRSQACNKVLNLLQQLMKINGATGLLGSFDADHSAPANGDTRPTMVDTDSASGSAISNMPFLPLTLSSDEPDSGVDGAPPTYEYVAISSSARKGVSAEGKDIMRSVTRVLMAGPRTMLWFPALLRAAEVLQLLILDASGAEEFLSTMYSERMPLAHGNLESHILLDMLHSINSTLQPRRLKPVRSLEHRAVEL